MTPAGPGLRRPAPPQDRGRHASRLDPAWARFAVHAAVAIAITAPLAWHPDRLPAGTEPVATVPRFNLWTLGWTADRLPHLLSGWWDAPIFWPTPGTFAFSEPQPLTGAVFALLRPLAGDAAAYSIVLLGALTLNGVCAGALARRLGARRWAAVLAGVLAQALPFVFEELGVLQLVMVWPLFATLAALLGWCERPEARIAALTGLGLGAAVLTCGYYASLFALCLVAAVPVLVRRSWWSDGPDERARRVGGVMIGGAVAAGLVLPVALGQLERLAGRRWLDSTVLAGSARVADWAPSGPLWPGWVLLGLAVAGLFVARRRRTTWFFVVFGAVALVTSAGSRLSILGTHPWEVVADHVAALGRLRSPFRAAALVQVALVALAAPALDRLAGSTHRWARSAAPGLVVVAVLSAGVGPGRLDPVPETPAWAGWLRDLPGQAPAVWLPFAPGTATADFVPTVDAMLATAGTDHPLVNGYSGFFPRDHAERRARLSGFPDERSVRELRRRGVAYVVADAGWLSTGDREDEAAGAGFRVIARDDVAVLLAVPTRDGWSPARS